MISWPPRNYKAFITQRCYDDAKPLKSIIKSVVNQLEITIIITIIINATLIEQRDAYSSLLVLLFSANNSLTLIYSRGSGVFFFGFQRYILHYMNLRKVTTCVILGNKQYYRNTGSMVKGANKVSSVINVNVVFQQYTKNNFF